MKVQTNRLKCRRCSYEWFPRKTEVRVCPNPKCHSPYWDRPRGEVHPDVAPSSGFSSIQPILKEMVRKIVQVADPEKIILFGSHATGHAGPGSDVDLLVVTRHGESRRQVAVSLYETLGGMGVPKDIVVVRPETFERYRDIPGSILYPAAREGRVIYERAA